MREPGRPPRSRYFDQFVAALADLESCGGLPLPSEAKDIWDDLWHREVHHSTAIEGNTLVLNEVKVLLEQGRTVGAKDLKDYLEVTGYAKAARWVYDRAHTHRDPARHELITVQEVREIHYRAMTDVWQQFPHRDALPSESPGNFREHDIHPFGGGMQPPMHPIVPSELSLWTDAVRALGDRLLDGAVELQTIPLELARIHSEFERVHPFIDGNGRAGRLALNLILVRLGWPPAMVFKSDRARYLAALNRADHGDAAPLGELIARSVVANVHWLLPEIAGPAKTVPLQVLADDQFSYAALKQAATRGRLEAHRGADGVWRSTRRAIQTYDNSRYKRT